MDSKNKRVREEYKNQTKIPCGRGEMKSGVRVELWEEAFFILPFCFVTFILGKQNKSKDGLSNSQFIIYT
ncbi:hypothetical protein GXP67_07730 [Rhodocytophaga rosea]|uniref:Uncharacterized protein n=1 Tax=Rhodocytophaga rosea TaxID=2704465 RepID=A0A6C0GFJ6_9BACT|nr:hypothetical protein [Rhodocytophaga rosea]QHT66553.1 hypothetical protein GXP67_07730 [Rhodocytophaga rosea]